MIVELLIKMAQRWSVTPLPMDKAISRFRDSAEYEFAQKFKWWILNEKGDANLAEVYRNQYIAVKFDCPDDDFVWMKMKGWMICPEGQRESLGIKELMIRILPTPQPQYWTIKPLRDPNSIV